MPLQWTLFPDSWLAVLLDKVAAVLVDLYSSPVWTVCLVCTVFCCLGAYIAFLMGQSPEMRHPQQSESKVGVPALTESLPPPQKSWPAKVNFAPCAPLAEGPEDGLTAEPTEKIMTENSVVADAGQTAPISPKSIFDSSVMPSGLHESSSSLAELGSLSVRVQPDLVKATEPPKESAVERSLPSFKTVNRQLLARGALEAEVADGVHHYVWDDNSEYFGNWENGKANGRGTFSWPSGDRYEGEWQDGLETGMGAYIGKDGSSFQGHWQGGQMHGKGVFQSAVLQETPSKEVYYMRDYDQGHLVAETKLREQEKDFMRKSLRKNHTARKHEKRKAAQEMAVPPLPGEVIYKGHHSYALMKSLQFGLLFSTSQGARAMKKTPSSADFKRTIRQSFPRSGDVASFKWKDYSPLVFRRLRTIFGIDDADYMLSLTGDSKLRELPSPGKSRSVFFISGDDRFMIKTVRKEEMNLLVDLIPKYHEHCENNHETLLTRFFGVHRIKPVTGNQVRFVVMANVFPIDTRLHRKFDLKGSSYGRTAGSKRDDPNATLKDLDVDFKLEMNKTRHSELMKQLQKDAKFLEKMRVMDYSLLLGMHYTEWVNSWNPVASHTVSRGSSPLGDAVGGPWQGDVRYESDDARQSMDSPHPDALRDMMPSCLKPSTSSPDAFRNGGTSRNGGTKPQSVIESHANTELEPSSRNSSLTSQDTSMLSSKPPSVFSHRSHRSLASEVPSLSTRQSGQLQPSRNSPASTVELDQPMNGVVNAFREAGNAFDSSSDMGGPVISRVECLHSATDVSPLGGTSPSTDAVLPYRSNGPKPPIQRTRSGWLKNEGSGEGLKSLKGEAIPHMGCSLPALAYSLNEDQQADLSQKAEPVTLFIGIIDFLQIYNFRKRGEHMFKSIVQDGKTISVTDPKTYAERFVKHMEGIFVSAK